MVIWGHFGVPFLICSCWVMEIMQLWLEACFLEVSGWIFWRIAMLGCGSNAINNESNSMSFVFQKSWLEEVPGVDFFVDLGGWRLRLERFWRSRGHAMGGLEFQWILKGSQDLGKPVR